MNKTLTLTLSALFSAFSLAAYAAGSNDAHAGHGAMHSAAEGGMVDGIVKKIDKAAGKVTVAHGPLTNLNMPAMTMAFRVKEAVWLDKLKQDGKIRFVADAINGKLTIIRLEVAK